METWPKPPPRAVKAFLAALRSAIDSGGVSASGLLGFGFGQNQADASVLTARRIAIGALSDQSLDHFGDFMLLPTREHRSRLENFLQAAFSGLFFGLGRRDAEQGVHADAEGVREFGQHFAARRLLRPFPKSDVGLRHAELGGQLLLRQTGGFAQFGQMLPVGGALRFCGASHTQPV
jgi:hypothetical protein